MEEKFKQVSIKSGKEFHFTPNGQRKSPFWVRKSFGNCLGKFEQKRESTWRGKNTFYWPMGVFYETSCILLLGFNVVKFVGSCARCSFMCVFDTAGSGGNACIFNRKRIKFVGALRIVAWP